MSQYLSMIIAGSTGLVGQSVLDIALEVESISHIYSLSRDPLEIEHQKLTQWLDPELNPPDFDTLLQSPNIGVIALGTTLKKAGTKDKLHAIDVELVIKVAKKMQSLGVQHIIIVSCLGASTKAASHYLRCKGEMEMAVQQLNFVKTTFVQPGPLAGPRKEQRKNEKLLLCLMKIIDPLLIGTLANYKSIESINVARAIIHLATEKYDVKNKQVTRLNSSQMLSLIR